MNNLKEQAIDLLSNLIQIESISRKEDKTAEYFIDWFANKSIKANRIGNNVYAINKYHSDTKPNLLLVSHHDTVPAAKTYTRDPFKSEIIDGKLYGLGSNDAGGALVTMALVFSYFYDKELPFNLLFCAAAEEEISGKNGLTLALPHLGEIDFAIVGEPTSLEMAVSEKGLLVCDCVAHGKVGHAARNEGDNAIIKAVKDIQWLNSYQFDKVSERLGPIKMTAAQIQGGVKHNVVPDRCEFVVDVRTTDAYTNEETLEIMRKNMHSDVTPRSTHIQPTATPLDHPVMQTLFSLNLKSYGSPTTSDQAVLSCPSVKLSPGDSKRSHSADEYIYVEQINEGIDFFIKFLEKLINDGYK